MRPVLCMLAYCLLSAHAYFKATRQADDKSAAPAPPAANFLLLPFLVGATNEQIKQYFSIVLNKDATKNTIRGETDAWAQAIGGDLLEKYNQFHAEAETNKSEARRNTTIVLEDLPTKLQEFYNIIDDGDKTVAEERAAVKEFLAAIDDFDLRNAVLYFIRPKIFIPHRAKRAWIDVEKRAKRAWIDVEARRAKRAPLTIEARAKRAWIDIEAKRAKRAWIDIEAKRAKRAWIDIEAKRAKRWFVGNNKHRQRS